MKLILSILLLATTSLSNLVYADEHGPQMIIGAQVLTYQRDHTFSGSIKGLPVFGAFDHKPMGAQLIIRKNNKSLTTQFANYRGRYIGIVREQRADAEGNMTRIQTAVEFVKIEKTSELEATLTLLVDNKELLVSIKAKEFKDNHFIEPLFETTLGDQPFKFHFLAGVQS